MTATLPPLPHPHTPGSARAALSYPAFRIVWIGMFLSMVGTWMQNVALGAYVQSRTGSGALVGVMVFAQLGPLLFLSIPGGVLANRFPRAPYIAVMQVVMMVGSLMLALAAANHASLPVLFVCNLAIGTANALAAPALQASVPMLVDRRDLPGAIALNSTQLNGSRVIGPLIVGLVSLWGVTEAQIFAINAATYVFLIVAVLRVQMPTPPRSAASGAGFQRLFDGIRIARSQPPIGSILVAMATFSLLSLPFISLFPTVADLGLHIAPKSATYKYLYAVWALGAMFGALSAGTILARLDKARLVRPSLWVFAGSLAVFGVLRGAAPAFPVGFVLGLSYFLFTTCLLTVLQQALADEDRAPVMALWFMAFGGTVPIGGMIFGPVIDRFGPASTLLIGAGYAAVLSVWLKLAPVRRSSIAVD
ncbi:MAG: MFS transporter [Ilumatobacteraceae bacterium]